MKLSEINLLNIGLNNQGVLSMATSQLSAQALTLAPTDENSNVVVDIQEQEQVTQASEINKEKAKEVFDKLDADKDGKLSGEELSKYVSTDSGEPNLSLEEIQTAFTQYGLEFEKPEDVKPPTEEKDTDNEDVKPETKKPETQKPVASQKTGGSRGGGGGGGEINSQIPTSDTPQDIADAVDNNSVEGLEKQKVDAQTNIDTAQSEISKINDGSSDKVSAEKQAMDKAQEEMDKAIKDDQNISDELKQEKQQVESDIQAKEQEISAQQTKISQGENKLSSLEGTLKGLENALKSVPAPTIKKDEQGNVISDNTKEIEARKKELNDQINAKKQEIDAAKAQLEEDKAFLNDTLKPDLDKLNINKTEVDGKIMEAAGEATKVAMDTFDKAKASFEAKKTSALSEVQQTISDNQTKINDLDVKINQMKNEELNKNFDVEFDEKMSGTQESSMKAFEENFEKNRERYEAAAKATGVPAELIAAIHWRESSGNFKTYLHNGDPLGKKTTHVPAGILCHTWEESAIDAFRRESDKMKLAGVTPGETTDWNKWLDFAERYNGLGCRKKGLPSPYVWAGTNKYTKGKYTRDHYFDPNHVDQQLGVALMLGRIV